MKLYLLYEDNVSQAVGILGGDSGKVRELKSSGIPNKYLPLAARLAKVGGELEEISKLIKDIINLVDTKKIKIELLRDELIVRANVRISKKYGEKTNPDNEYHFPYNSAFIDELKEFLIKLDIKYLSMEQGEAASEEDLVATGDNIKVYYADSKAKCKAYGKNTTFCISANTDERNQQHMYEYYRSHGWTTYFVFDDNNKDNPLNLVVVQVDSHGNTKLTDKTNDTGYIYRGLSPREYYAYLREKGIGREVFKPKKLNAREAIRMGDINVILDYIKETGVTTTKMYDMILADPTAIPLYAEILGTRWPDGEKVLERGKEYLPPGALMQYAVVVLNKTGERLKKFEPYFLKDKAYLVTYAEHTRHRFPDYEDILFDDSDSSMRLYGYEPSAVFEKYYEAIPKQQFPGGRWQEYEDYLFKKDKEQSTSFDVPSAALNYAKHFGVKSGSTMDKKLRSLIIKDLTVALEYVNVTNKEPWPELEDLLLHLNTMSRNGNYCHVKGSLNDYLFKERGFNSGNLVVRKLNAMVHYVSLVGKRTSQALAKELLKNIKEAVRNDDIDPSQADHLRDVAGFRQIV